METFEGSWRCNFKRNSFHTQDDDVLLRRNMHRDEKAAIAKYAASLITADDFIYLDAGTTTDSMIDFMDVKPSCVVTNAVAHAKRLSELGCEVYIIPESSRHPQKLW